VDPQKSTKYRTLIDEKKLTFSKPLYPYDRMLPFGIIKPLDNEELFPGNGHTFGISTLIEPQIHGKRIFYSLASRSRP
jgi:hypothetical protein